MKAKTVWFKRGDGETMCASEGSASWEAMMRDGSFQEIDIETGQPVIAESAETGEAVEPVNSGTASVELDLDEMVKAQLIEYVTRRGIEVNPKVSKAVIIETIKAAEAEAKAGAEAESGDVGGE